MVKFDKDSSEVQDLIEKKYLSVQKHPTADLWLYCYSKSCQMNKIWNDITCICRGLVVDKEGNIVARPFKKFFNYEELSDKTVIPNLPFEAYEKLDGSLGIMYWIGDDPHITTKGSFVSEQGQHGDWILHKKYSEHFGELDKTKTYLFEIIWNEDHHCVSYGNIDDIFLLAVIDTETGEEEDIYRWENIFKCTKRYDGVSDWKSIRDMYSGDNREGFVIKFSNNYRLKLKYESYFRIHFLRCKLSEKYVLDLLLHDELDNLLESIRDLDEENQIYAKEIVAKFQGFYTKLENECKEYLATLPTSLTELEKIKQIKEQTLYGIMFKMWRGQDYKQTIWKFIKNNYRCKRNAVEDDE